MSLVALILDIIILKLVFGLLIVLSQKQLNPKLQKIHGMNQLESMLHSRLLFFHLMMTILQSAQITVQQLVNQDNLMIGNCQQLGEMDTTVMQKLQITNISLSLIAIGQVYKVEKLVLSSAIEIWQNMEQLAVVKLGFINMQLM